MSTVRTAAREAAALILSGALPAPAHPIASILGDWPFLSTLHAFGGIDGNEPAREALEGLRDALDAWGSVASDLGLKTKTEASPFIVTVEGEAPGTSVRLSFAAQRASFAALEAAVHAWHEGPTPAPVGIGKAAILGYRMEASTQPITFAELETLAVVELDGGPDEPDQFSEDCVCVGETGDVAAYQLLGTEGARTVADALARHGRCSIMAVDVNSPGRCPCGDPSHLPAWRVWIYANES